jgi:hypothetical protein
VTGDTEAAETAARHEGVNGSENAEQDARPPWTDAFSSPDELFTAFRNVDSLRGRQAGEIGELRRQLRDALAKVAFYEQSASPPPAITTASSPPTREAMGDPRDFGETPSGSMHELKLLLENVLNFGVLEQMNTTIHQIEDAKQLAKKVKDL